MEWVWTSLLIAGSFCVLIGFLPVQIELQYARNKERDKLRLRFSIFFGLLRYTIEFPLFDLVANANQQFQIKATAKSGIGDQAAKHLPIITIAVDQIRRALKIQYQFMDRLHNFFPYMRQFSKTFRVQQLKWSTEIGVGDAALTGTAAGLVWSVKGTVVGLVSHLLTMQTKPVMFVRPMFLKTGFETRIDCIIRFWVGQAIFEGIKLVIYLLREGKRPWRIIRSKD
jgi:hypothetical protein